jgi:hypothetical protein
MIDGDRRLIVHTSDHSHCAMVVKAARCGCLANNSSHLADPDRRLCDNNFASFAQLVAQQYVAVPQMPAHRAPQVRRPLTQHSLLKLSAQKYHCAARPKLSVRSAYSPKKFSAARSLNDSVHRPLLKN